MPIGQSKAIWQCKLFNLVANFRTHASDVTWLPRNQNMHMWKKYKTDFKKYWKSEIDKERQRASHSRLSSQREQSLLTCVLILVSFKEVGCVHAHLWLQVQVHDHHHHRSPKWPHSSPGWDSEREPCVLTNFGTKQCKWFHLMTKFLNILHLQV